MTRRTLMTLALAAIVGCGVNPGQRSEPIKVSGKVAFANGRPVRDLKLSLQPTAGDGVAVSVPLGPDGSFSGDFIPGKYAFFFEPLDGKEAARSATALRQVPEKYRQAHMAHLVDLSGPGVEVRLEGP